MKSKNTLAAACACLLLGFGSFCVADDGPGKGGLKDEYDGKTWTKSGSVTGPQGNVTEEGTATVTTKPGQNTVETSGSLSGPNDRSATYGGKTTVTTTKDGKSWDSSGTATGPGDRSATGSSSGSVTTNADGSKSWSSSSSVTVRETAVSRGAVKAR